MIPTNIQEDLAAAEADTRRLEANRTALPGKRREVRAKWAAFVDAVRTDTAPAAAFRDYVTTAKNVDYLARQVFDGRHGVHQKRVAAVAKAANDINGRLLAATVYDNAGHTTVTPYKSAEDRDAMIREALDDATELAQRLGIDDYEAPAQTPEARHDAIRIPAWTFTEHVVKLPRVETSLTIRETYSAALDQAQTEILRAA
ncbi:hypothetical protein [Microbacterium indicum]|uniref:hypothetical protein n=1 Tax=Microbacterium indicum TaxID=358100 RepID=UPI00042858D2|nr:hypothetical protein [Microbacterium indicum]